MPLQPYPWARFWHPRDITPELDDLGFLVDSLGSCRDRFSRLVQLDSMRSQKCLLLIGEPGLGKSSILEVEASRIEVEVPGARTLVVRLGEFSPADLRAHISGHRDVLDWRRPAAQRYLFLDALDEGMALDPTLPRYLERLLSDLGEREQLHLRVTCRSTQLPESFIAGLKTIFDEQSVGVYTLAPLRLADVRAALELHRLDIDRFFAELQEKDVVPIATNPFGLALLIKEFEINGGLPGGRLEIYERGCLQHCREFNTLRQESGEPRLRGRLSAEGRVAVASRIAGVMLLSGRQALVTRPAVETSERIVTTDDLVGYGEEALGRTIAVEQADVEETLDTRLFTAGGYWAHQTYAEYLGARFLADTRITMTKVKSLLTNPQVGDGRIVEPLQVTAAWLAGMRDDVFEFMLEHEELALVRNATVLSVSQRERLVGRLLSGTPAWKLESIYQDLRPELRKLNHPSIERQLQAAIGDRALHPVSRRNAVALALETRTRQVQEAVLGVILSGDENINLRIEAALYLARLGESEVVSELRPLLLSAQPAEDVDCSLWGLLLQTLWPGHLAPEELFSCLVEPDSHAYTTYTAFIEERLVRALISDDASLDLVEAGVRWLCDRPALIDDDPPLLDRSWLGSGEDGVVIAVLRRVGEFLGNGRLIDWFIERLCAHNHLVLDDGELQNAYDRVLESMSADHRRTLVRLLLREAGGRWDDVEYALWSVFPGLLRPDDFEFVAELLAEEVDLERKKRLSSLLLRFIDRQSSNDVDRLYSVCQQNPILMEELRWLFGPIEIDSELSRRERKRHLKGLEAAARSSTHRSQPRPTSFLQSDLEIIENGEVARWHNLVLKVGLQEDGRYQGGHRTNLASMPGWKSASPDDRTRIVDAAIAFLRGPRYQEASWVLASETNIHAYAPIKALMLLGTERPEALGEIPTEVWRNWTPEIIEAAAHGVNDDTCLIDLAHRAFEADEALFKEHLLGYLLGQRERNAESTVDRLGFALDIQILDTLFASVTSDELGEDFRINRADALMLKSHEQTIGWALVRVVQPIPEETVSQGDTQVVCDPVRDQLAALLVRRVPACTWDEVLGHMHADPAFGARVLGHAMQGRRLLQGKDFLTGLGEARLGELLEWLYTHFPPATDLDHKGRVYQPEWRDDLASLRGQIIRYLAIQATPAGCSALDGVASNHQEYPYLAIAAEEARSLLRSKTWRAPAPQEALEVVKRHQRRLVRNGRELMDVVLEQLEGIAIDMRGDNGLARFLWDEHSLTPKHEEAISQLIAFILRQRLGQMGVVINREAVIRTAYRTDVQVIVPAAEGAASPELKLVIEVKKSSHQHVKSALADQLVAQYLNGTECNHGIYLVAWDGRSGSPAEGIEAFVAEQQAIARTFSNGKDVRAFVMDIRIPRQGR